MSETKNPFVGQLFRTACMAAAVASLASAVHAVDKTWTGSVNASFATASNWNPSGMPGTFDTAIFNVGIVTPPYNVLFLTGQFQAINAVVDRLRIDSNPITFTPPPSTLTIDSTNITETGRGLVIGRTPPGRIGTPTALLTNLLTELNTVYATLGADAASSGTLNINGGTFNVTGTSAQFALIVGLNGSAVITAISGHDVDVAGNTVIGKNAGSGGSANLTGTGTIWSNSGSLTIGYAGQGTFNITNSGQLQTALPATLGDQPGSLGDVNVSGGTWNMTPNGVGYELTIGRSGTGSLDIWAGGDVIAAGDAVMAFQPGSSASATIDGPGSQWIQSGELHLGYRGFASLGITGGALLQTTYGYVGGYPSAPDAAGDASVDISGANSHWNTTTGWISLGNGANGAGGQGTLTITSAGRATTTDLSVGNSFNSVGHASVSGPGSLLQINAGDCFVGLQGEGTLHISNGGEVDISSGGSSTIGWHADTAGHVLIDGAQSKWDTAGPLIVGESGDATLDISAGGRVTSTGTSYVGKSAGSSGQAAVDGSGSIWTNTGLEIGHLGDGTLDITDAGEVSVIDDFGVLIGTFADGTGFATVDGANSRLSTLAMTVGFEGDGTLNITNGGAVEVDENISGVTLRLGLQLGSMGTANVDGRESTMSVELGSTPFIVGKNGHGILNITGGGRVESVMTHIGEMSTGLGEVVVDGAGSKWVNSGQIHLGVASQQACALTVSNGGVVDVHTLLIGLHGQLHGDGQIVSLDGNANTNVASAGLVSPGTSIGTLHIQGNYTQANQGAQQQPGLLIEIGSASSFDQLAVSALATLDGELTVNLLNGFTPNPGQTFTILTAGDVDGTFAQINAPAGVTMIYGPTSVQVKWPGTLCSADIFPVGLGNGDGFVGPGDLGQLLSNWGFCDSPCPADLFPAGSGDGTVGPADLGQLLSQWGPCR